MLKNLQHITGLLESKIRSSQQVFNGNNNKLYKVLSVMIFFLALSAFYSYVGIYEHISERPCSIHSSAQCMRASVALNYYNIDMNFFKPRIQRFYNSDGITGIEFPIVYYAGAIAYKIFGYNDAYLRIISLLIVTLGIFVFYLLSQQFLRNTLLSLLVVCSVIVSPVLLYYSANFLPDAPAFAFVLFAWYFFFRYITSNKASHLNLFVVFGTLAALIKVISVMCFLVVFCVLILDKLKFFKDGSRGSLFLNKKKIVVRSLLGMFVVICWYAYARIMASIYGNPPTAMEPMMVFDEGTLRTVWKYAQNWIFDYYSSETYTFLGCAIVLTAFNIRRVNKLLLSITVIYILGSACYVILFLYQFMHHDYYIIAMLPCVFFFMLTFFDAVNRFSVKKSMLINMLFIVIVFFNVKESVEKCRENYFFRYEAKAYLSGEFRQYYDLGPRLKALGIRREDKFACAFDDSYSNSLYFINQAGFTIENDLSTEKISEILNAPDVKYLVVSDSAKFNKVYPNNYAKDIILYHRGLIIYKLPK